MSILAELLPKPAPFKEKSRTIDLKSRLDWGEPALTIVDVRNREAFHESHVMGAVSMPAEELVERAIATLEPERDIYLYGEVDEETAAAAAKLRAAGYKQVSELIGGLAAWRAACYPIESTRIEAA